MGTLADSVPDMAVIRSAVWRVLKGDSTLQGATYLAAAGRIVPGDKAPEQLKNAPRLHIEFLPGAAIVLDDVGSGRVVLRLRSVLQNPSDGVSADDGRHGRISSRAGYLCTGHGVFTDTAYRFMELLGAVGERRAHGSQEPGGKLPGHDRGGAGTEGSNEGRWSRRKGWATRISYTEEQSKRSRSVAPVGPTWDSLAAAFRSRVRSRRISPRWTSSVGTSVAGR